jgi:5-methylcytosine-specific restriction endonuclease McrA
MSEARAARIFLAAKGKCHICGNAIRDGEAWDADHVEPLWAGGADDDANLAPAHVKCHAGKTGTEAGHRSRRNKAITASFKGKRRPRGFDPNLTRKFNGTVIDRRTGLPVSRMERR